MRRSLVLSPLLVLVLVLAACGGDDGGSADAGDDVDAAADGADGAASAGGGGDDASVGDDETALGDPCELVTAADVESVLGAPSQASLAGVGDGLPGAFCQHVGDFGFVAIGVTPGGASFYDANKGQVAAADLTELDGPGDESFRFQDVEVQTKAGDHLVIVQVSGPELSAATDGVALAELMVTAIG